MTVTTSTPVLPERIESALAPLTLSDDGTFARLHDRELTAEDPREMRRLLTEALYEELHTGHRVDNDELSRRMRDADLEHRLAKAVPHQRTAKRATVRKPPDGTGPEHPVLVELDGLRVRVPAERIVEGDRHASGAAVTLSVPALRPALSPGFFLADGSRAGIRGHDALRVYLHLTNWRQAPDVWATVLRMLEDREVAYRAKILSTKALYPRRDAMVVYLPAQWADAAGLLRDTVRTLPGVGAETSLLAERLAPGIATAWEPVDRRPGMRGLSFGQHRASAIAGALLERAEYGGELAELMARWFVAANIDPEQPHRNLESG